MDDPMKPIPLIVDDDKLDLEQPLDGNNNSKAVHLQPDDGEGSVGGTTQSEMPNVNDARHEVGLGPNTGDRTPQQVGMAQDYNKRGNE